MVNMNIYNFIGLVDYRYALALMKRMVKYRLEKLVGDTILIMEHKPVITIGVDGDISNIHIPHYSIPIYPVKRGGDVTLHSPGQLMVYPIIKIDERNMRIIDVIRLLEETTIQLLKYYD